MKTILENISRVLVIRCGALGDLVYATSIIDALRLQYGEGIKIDFLTTPGPAKLFEFDSRVNKIFFLKHKKPPIWLSKEKKAIINHAKKEPYDLLINLEQNRYFDHLAKNIEALHKVGAPFNTVPPQDNNIHMVDVIKMMYAPVFDDAVLNQSFPKLLSTHFKPIQEKFHLPDRYIVLNPSNSHHRRNIINYRAWPQEQWKKLLKQLPQDIPLIMIGGNNELDYFTPIKPYAKNVIDLVGKTSLAELSSIINNAQAIVTTDTGPAHLASAVSTPIYVLIGPTPVMRTGPYPHQGAEVHIITKNLECSPCYNTEVIKNCQDNICMRQITPEDVIERMSPLLATFK